MILRPIGVRTVLFTLILAAPCLAQEAPAPSPTPAPEAAPAPVASPEPLATPEPEPAPAATPPAATPAPAPAPAPATPPNKSFPNHGGIGGLIGGSWFYAAEDYSQGAHPRFDFSGQFRYAFNHTWRAQVSPGFTWSAYSKKEPPPFIDPKFPDDATKESYLTLLIPVSAQIQWVTGKTHWLYHVGAGPGFYHLWVENHRKVLVDPGTLKLHRSTYFGFAAEIGVERFMPSLPKTSIELSMVHHYVFAEQVEDYPAGWNSNLGTIALRVGANYYFDLNKPQKSPELPGIK